MITKWNLLLELVELYLKCSNAVCWWQSERDSAWWLVSWDSEFFESVELYSAQLLLRSPRTEHFESVKFYSEDGLQMAVNWWHWGKYSAHLFFRSPRVIFYQVIRLIFKRHFEMTGHLVVTLRGDTLYICY